LTHETKFANIGGKGVSQLRSIVTTVPHGTRWAGRTCGGRDLRALETNPWRIGRTAMSRNTIKTFTLLAGLAVLAGQLLGGLAGAVIGLALVGGSYWFSDRIAIRAAGAAPSARTRRRSCTPWWPTSPPGRGSPPRGSTCRRRPQPNAFATGRNEHTAVIAVTQGLLDELSPWEVRGVLAHEMAHVAKRDILIGSVAAAISMDANLAAFGMLFGGDDEESPNPLTLLAAALVAPVSAGLLQMAVSRSREYEADRTGAALLGDGTALAAAFVRIDDAARRTPMPVDPAQTSHYIVNPLTGRQVRVANLFLTHPPTEERVARLLHAPEHTR
jgi:heat shock protein HtpX